jgi:crossover junction endodeoxyribonuclease RusA
VDPGQQIRIETGWPHPMLWPNARPHFMSKHMKTQAAKQEAYWSTKTIAPRGFKAGDGRLKLTIEAHPAVERGRDDDNLISACKAARDGIADALGINDKQFDLQPVVWADKHKTGRLFFIVEPAP